MSTDPKVKISNYDKENYDYKTYWNERSYEDIVEQKSVEKLLGQGGRRIIDIGGSFGRLLPTYANKYTEVVIVDYSLETLKKYQADIKQIKPDAILIAANAYKLPFKDSSFDGGVMMRVLHHIQAPDAYFKEISRVLCSNSRYIQEFANKIHIKARISAALKGRWEIFSEEPYQQPTTKSAQKEGSTTTTVFLNFHPRYIRKLMIAHGFKIRRRVNTSLFRIPKLKQLFSAEFLAKLELLIQPISSLTYITPSILYKAELDKLNEDDHTHTPITEILCCPTCKMDVVAIIENDTKDAPDLKCKACRRVYTAEEGIYDFRID